MSGSFELDRDEAAETCSIHFIRNRLGRRDFGATRLLRYLELLIAEEGFPPPLPDLVGRALVRRVTLRSVWIREAVEAWLHDWLPPGNAVAVDAAALRQAAAEMDAAATGLRLVQGGRA